METNKSKESLNSFIDETILAIKNLSDEDIKSYIISDKKKDGKELNVTKEEIDNKRASMIKLVEDKKVHSIDVGFDSKETAHLLNFNESTMNFVETSGLMHDVGRFAQVYLTGNYIDSRLAETYPNIQDHGELGRIILEKNFITSIRPTQRIYDSSITTIVGEHAKGNLSGNLGDKVSNLKIFANFDINDILANSSFIDQLNAITIQIVQDVDRLDIYHQIITGKWSPLIVDDLIPEEVFDMFFRGEYLNMTELRGRGLWNANVGELVRLGFVNHLKLVGVARLIEQEKLLYNMFQIRDIENRSKEMPLLKEAYNLTIKKLTERINKSNDGIYLESKQR